MKRRLHLSLVHDVPRLSCVARWLHGVTSFFVDRVLVFSSSSNVQNAVGRYLQVNGYHPGGSILTIAPCGVYLVRSLWTSYVFNDLHFGLLGLATISSL